ncbi:MAG TPA: MASE1 domain-containing protein [Gaiellaceae bacterium]|jgi:signal transduction histidine kinase|nr:MASE1 domain-containing protein [Gaiellaceae bacterium]
MTTQAQPFLAQRPADPTAIVLRSRYVAGVLMLAAAYYGAAKLGQTLRYTASVSAIWPPAGLGIAAIYLWGFRWWPGVFIGELVVNGELLFDDSRLPLGSLIGQQAGNMAEILVGAALLRRLIGPRAALDRAEQVVGMLASISIATAISATVGMVSMLLGGVIDTSELAKFWRTWWLGDTAGALVVLPLALAWFRNPLGAFRRMRSWEGGCLIAAVVVLGVLAVSTSEPATYVVFPALIWAAFRFGPQGATLAITFAAGAAIAFTAHKAGPFFKQPIDHRTLSTQVYIVFAALTTLFLSAVVSERERSASELAEAKRHEGEQAVRERHRIARDLHDSVSQALFSTILHTRIAQKLLRQGGTEVSVPLSSSLDAIGDLTRAAQTEMRALIFELGRDAVTDGLAAALSEHASALSKRHGLLIDVDGPESTGLSPQSETQLFGIAREALANVVKHSSASRASVRVEARPDWVFVEISDNGHGFDPDAGHPGHFGLDSMRSRAGELGGLLTISSAPGHGTVVRVEAPAEAGGELP